MVKVHWWLSGRSGSRRGCCTRCLFRLGGGGITLLASESLGKGGSHRNRESTAEGMGVQMTRPRLPLEACAPKPSHEAKAKPEVDSSLRVLRKAHTIAA